MLDAHHGTRTSSGSASATNSRDKRSPFWQGVAMGQANRNTPTLRSITAVQVLPLLAARTLLAAQLLMAATLIGACGDDGSASASGTDAGADAATKRSEWPGDPCSLLTDDAFAMITPVMKIHSTDPHNVGSQELSPECHFALQGDGESATVAVYVDPVADYQLQKDIFKGKDEPDLGNSAWTGNVEGRGNSTVGVLIDDVSFRVDSTYTFEYDDLKILAGYVAARFIVP